MSRGANGSLRPGATADAGTEGRNRRAPEQPLGGLCGVLRAHLMCYVQRMNDDDPLARRADDDPRPLMEALPGAWRLLRSDAGLEFAADARLSFNPDGTLDYGFTVEGTSQSIEMRWHAADDRLSTEVPGAGIARNLRARVGAGGVLILDFGGARAYFVRER